MGIFNQEQKQNIRSRYGDTTVWSFIQSICSQVLGNELEQLRVTNQGILYEVFRITDYLMGENTHEEKVHFCHSAFEVENERVNEYSNETAGRTEIQITTYLIVHLATVLLCTRDEYAHYALEILNSCHSQVSSKVREKIGDGVACILEEEDNLVGNRLQMFMKSYGQNGRWISKDIEAMSHTKKDDSSGKGYGESVPPQLHVTGNVTYINNNNAPFISGMQTVTPNHLSALQNMMGMSGGQPLQAIPTAEDFSEVKQENPSVDVLSYPESQLDAVLFNEALDMFKLKQALGTLVARKRQRDELKIAHWFIVWKVFRRHNFIPKQQTQSKFIQWATDVFGWDWQAKDFKGSVVPEGVRNIPLDEWTIEKLSAQRPQAEEYMGWRDALTEAFLTDGGNGRKDCKDELCTRWFDTNLG